MFIANIPVSHGDFFNREADLARIDHAIEKLRRGAPQWLCLIGNRRVGKTSLLLQTAARAGDVGFVVVDVMENAPLSSDVFRAIALGALDAAMATGLGEAPSVLARRPAEYTAAIVGAAAWPHLDRGWQQFVLELPELKPSSRDFVKLCLELPEVLAKATGKKLVIAIDEFQELSQVSLPHSADPMALMRSIWQRHRNVGYFISGSSRSMLLELTTSEASPFFQHFETLFIEPFDEQHSVALLVTASRDTRRIPTTLALRVYETLGGHPFYLQVLGDVLSRRTHRSDERALRETLQEVLFSRTGTLSLYFERNYERLVGRATTLAAVLEQLAKGPMRMADVARGIGASTGPTLGYLHRLGDAVVRTEDGCYTLADRVFGLWLQWRGPGGTTVPMSVVGDEAELAVARELAQMGFQTVYQSRGSRGAFDLLAMRGATQLAVQVKRRALPLRFKAPEWQRMQADAKTLGWKWVVAGVDQDGVHFLNPAKARSRQLGPAAKISNLLEWLGPPSRRG